jgi:hypothetical protein
MSEDQNRQIPLKDLSAVCRAAQGLLAGGADAPSEGADPIVIPVTAKCVQCGIHLDAKELARLALPDPSAESLSPKLERVLKGYCARAECPSYYYHVELGAGSGLDWSRVERAMAGDAEAANEQARAERRVVAQEQRAFAVRWLGKLAAAAAVLVLLLMFRQWYIGGTIPLIREPQPFTIDPSSLDR